MSKLSPHQAPAEPETAPATAPLLDPHPGVRPSLRLIPPSSVGTTLPWITAARETRMMRILFRAPDGILGQCTFSSAYCSDQPEFVEARLALMQRIAEHYRALGCEVLGIERLQHTDLEL